MKNKLGTLGTWGKAEVVQLAGAKVVCCQCGWPTWSRGADGQTMRGWHIESYPDAVTCPKCCKILGITETVTPASQSHRNSQYHGVSWRGDLRKCWVAFCFHDGRQHHVGSYYTELEAARAFDIYEWSRSHDTARLNFPAEVHDE